MITSSSSALLRLIALPFYLAWLWYSSARIIKATPNLDLILEQQVEKLIGAEHPFTILSKIDAAGVDERAAFKIKRVASVKTMGGLYLLALIYDHGRDSLVQYISELRARRTLFNKPKEYLAAFGESPNRKQLARLMGEADA